MTPTSKIWLHCVNLGKKVTRILSRFKTARFRMLNSLPESSLYAESRYIIMYYFMEISTFYNSDFCILNFQY